MSDATPTPTPTEPVKNPKDKIPGLEITWEDAEILELSEDGVKTLVALKQANQQVRLSLVPLRDNKIFVVRNCSRHEWRNVVAELQSADPEKTQIAGNSNLTQQAIEQQIAMMNEDRLVARFLVHPKLSIQEIRDMDPGDVKCLNDSIMMGLGYMQPPRSIKI